MRRIALILATLALAGCGCRAEVCVTVDSWGTEIYNDLYTFAVACEPSHWSFDSAPGPALNPSGGSSWSGNGGVPHVNAPEINPSAGAAAITLLAGVLCVIRARRRK